MIRKDAKGNIEITRGDYLPLEITAKCKDGSYYTFKVGDVVRFSIMEKGNCNSVVLRKSVTVNEEASVVVIEVSSEEMKIGGLINKPVQYWYEVELNPNTPKTQTIIGYTKEQGAKILTLTPESGDNNE